MGGTCSTHEKDAYKILGGKCEGKIPLGRPRRKWEDYRMLQWIVERSMAFGCALDSGGWLL
jgi:hypothetical protein